MQQRLAACEHEITEALPVEDVDCVVGPIPVDVLPRLPRQLIQSEVAKTTAGVARIVQRELAESRPTLVKDHLNQATLAERREGLRRRVWGCRFGVADHRCTFLNHIRESRSHLEGGGGQSKAR